MKNSILIFALLAAAVVCSALYAVAADPLVGFDSGLAVEEPDGGAPEMAKGRHFARLVEILELTPGQQEKIKSIQAAEQEMVAPLREELREGRKQLRTAIDSQPFDEAAVRTLAASQAAIRTELIVSRAKVQSQVHALLTPEQRKLAEKLRPLMEKRQGPRGQHHRGTER